MATIEPSDNPNDVVPVLIWEIQPKDEVALDRYEGYPWLYRKENIEVKVNGEVIEIMTYIMNDGKPINEPSEVYYETIKQGYIDNRFDIKVLELAREDSIR